MTKSDDLIGEVAAYSLAAGLAQTASHLILAADPKLPRTWKQLVARYTAGSGIVAATLTIYAWRHRGATASDAVVMHWGVLLGCGAAVAALHLADYLRERDVARALDAAYDRENTGHVASPTARPPLPIPLRGRA